MIRQSSICQQIVAVIIQTVFQPGDGIQNIAILNAEHGSACRARSVLLQPRLQTGAAKKNVT